MESSAARCDARRTTPRSGECTEERRKTQTAVRWGLRSFGVLRLRIRSAPPVGRAARVPSALPARSLLSPLRASVSLWLFDIFDRSDAQLWVRHRSPKMHRLSRVHDRV